MGRLKHGIQGPVAGKVGNLIFSSWKGIPYVKTRPATIKNPRSPAQTSQRSAFGLVQRLIGPARNFVREGFALEARGMSAYNAAISYNIKQAVTQQGGTAAILYSRFSFSRGEVGVVDNVRVDVSRWPQLRLTWDAGAGSPEDWVIPVLVNETIVSSFLYPAQARRNEHEIMLLLPQEWTGQTLHLYLCLKKAYMVKSDSKNRGISDTVYVGKLEPES